jgi:hypothetical protein
MTLESELRAEIKKWTSRLDDILPKVEPADDHGDKMFENIEAYRKDSEHFLAKGDLVRSFECLIWAWAILETGKNLRHLKLKS